MRVIIDKYIPFLAEELEPIAEVLSLEPEEITPQTVKSADALIIRTRTKANHQQLDGSKVQFIATATIGFDHIDTTFCQENDIEWTACPGCNAQAVTDFTLALLNNLAYVKHPLSTPKLGVIGYGHIGSLVAKEAKQKGWEVLVNDPPKNIGVTLDEIAEKCDVITFHTPLPYAPRPFPTHHLGDAAFLSRCKPDAFIINAARGGIVDEYALLQSGHKCAIDCWENEPNINRDLLLSPNTLFASYHIAGYSWEGKINASQMCLDAFCKHFGLSGRTLNIQKSSISPDLIGDSKPGWIERISKNLKAHPEQFELLRKQYLLR